MPYKIVYMTAKAPYGQGEVWALREFISLQETGIEMILIPRSYSRKRTVPIATNLDRYTIHIQLLNLDIAKEFLKVLLRNPKRIASFIIWIIRQSNHFVDFLKGVAVLPKSVYLGRLLSQEDIVHIHAQSTTSVAVMAYVLSRLLGVPWSLSLHSSSIVNETHKRSFTAFLDTASFMRCVNCEGREKLISLLGPNYRHKLKVIHLGVKPVESATREVKNDTFEIVTPASLNEQKGHKYAIEASQILLSRKVCNFKWTFYGTGPLERKIRELIAGMELGQNIFVEGFIENDALLAMYQNGLVHSVILPSIIGLKGTYEGIPYSLMEAMAYGIPVIVTNTGGTNELIGGGAGIAIPPNNSAAIADAIVKLMNDPAYRSSIGKSGQEKVSREFNINDTITQLMKFMNLGDNVW